MPVSTALSEAEKTELRKLQFNSRIRATWRPEWIPDTVAIESAKHLIEDHEAVTENQSFIVRGRRFLVQPMVFNPNFFWGNETTCAVLMERVPETGSFMEIGSGAGYVSVTLALEKPELNVYAGDISPAAVENTRLNAKLFNCDQKMSIEQSNVFDAFKASAVKFDYVYWNYPYGHTAMNYDELNNIMKGLWDPFYGHLHKIFEDGLEMVSENGRILLTFSNEVGFFDAFSLIADLYGWQAKEVASSTPDNFDMRHRYMECTRRISQASCSTVH